MMLAVHHEFQDVPVTAAIKDVLEQISSDKYQEIARSVQQQRPLLHQPLFDAQLLQRLARELSGQTVLSYQDVAKIKTVVDTMKEDIVDAMQQSQPYDRASLQRSLCELSCEAMIALDSLTARHIDDDLLDLKQMLAEAQELLLEGKSDKKLTVRMLSIINEIFQKHDELFVSTYDIVMLSHVALIIFFMGSL